MFEHFIFGACAQTLYTQDQDISTSPTDTSFPSPIFASVPSFSDECSPFDGIIDAFAQSSLRLDENEQSQPSIWNDHLPTPTFSSNNDCEFTLEELSYVSTRRNMAKVPLIQLLNATSVKNVMEPRNGTVACRRAKRMMDTKALVEDMIETGEQCTLHSSTNPKATSPRSTPPPSIPLPRELLVDTRELHEQEDEGFGEMEEDTTDLLDVERFNVQRLEMDDEMTLRRASTPSGIRKYNVMKWRKSAEIIGAGPGLTASGRAKVKCVPRMRRRKCKSVPE